MNLQKETSAEPTVQNRADRYSLLRESRRTDGSFKSIEGLEAEYVELTDKLIHKMTHGERVSHNGEYSQEIPTKVIFLDKSARPVAWLVRELWDTLAPDPGSDEVPPKPDFKFLNIDRNQWKDQLDPNGALSYDANRVSDEQIEGLRSIYGKNGEGSFDVENEMDDQVIMIVDEVRSSGATLDIAKSIVQRAFPNSKVFGSYWMAGMASANGATGNADLPVWYRDDSTNAKMTPGRGVGNRRHPSTITHPSQYFLSTPLPEPDQRALRLREDFKALHDGLNNREITYIPSRDRDDAEERSEKVNGLSLKQAYLARRAINDLDATRR